MQLPYYGHLPESSMGVSITEVADRVRALAQNDTAHSEQDEKTYWALLLFFSYHQHSLDEWWLARERGRFFSQWNRAGDDKAVFEFLQRNRKDFGHLLDDSRKARPRDVMLQRKRYYAFETEAPLVVYRTRWEDMAHFPKKMLKHFDVMQGKLLLTYLDVPYLVWHRVEREARRVAALLTKSRMGPTIPVGLERLLDPENSPVTLALRRHVPHMLSPSSSSSLRSRNQTICAKPKGALIADLEDLAKTAFPPCLARVVYKALHKKEHPQYAARVVFVPAMAKVGYCQEDIEQAMLKMYPEAEGDVKRLNSQTGHVIPHFYTGVVEERIIPTACAKAKEWKLCPMGDANLDGEFAAWYGAEKSRLVSSCDNCGKLLPTWKGEHPTIRTPYSYIRKATWKQ